MMVHRSYPAHGVGRPGLSALLLGVAVCAASVAQADNDDRLYDFTDAYYLQNGINPAAISGRRQADGVRAVADAPFFSYQRPVRALLTFPAYDHSANPWFFTVLGGGNTSLFTNDSAGRNAMRIADRSIEYVFPPRTADPLSLGGRQTNLLDMRNGYFSNNPLGLWIHVWVNYTDRAFNTSDGRKELDDLARRNGLATDGTPIINTVSDIDRLSSKGLITKRTRPATDPLRYAICPVIEDPTDGGIAPDQYLSYTKRPDGSPLEPGFLLNFLSLQQTGDWGD
jgi:hypothetical protein